MNLVHVKAFNKILEKLLQHKHRDRSFPKYQKKPRTLLQSLNRNPLVDSNREELIRNELNNNDHGDNYGDFGVVGESVEISNVEVKFMCYKFYSVSDVFINLS